MRAKIAEIAKLIAEDGSSNLSLWFSNRGETWSSPGVVSGGGKIGKYG